MLLSWNFPLVRGVLSWSSWSVVLSIAFIGAGARAEAGEPAVAAPNFRVGVGYDYSHVAETTIRIPLIAAFPVEAIGEADQHAVIARLGGTFPLGHSFGLRASCRPS